jgi:hypothetical protein
MLADMPGYDIREISDPLWDTRKSRECATLALAGDWITGG